MGNFKDKNPYVKAAIILGAIAAVGTTAVVIQRLVVRSNDKKRLASSGGTVDPSQSSGSLSDLIFGNTPTSCKHCVKTASYPLALGSQGKQVAALQYAYNIAYPGKKILVDGDWGNKTQTAWQEFKSDVQSKFPIKLGHSISEDIYNKVFKKYENI